MKRYVAALLFSVSIAVGTCGQSSAEGLGEEIVGEFFKDLTGIVVGGAKKELENNAKKREQEANAVKERGFCQIWSNASLSKQEQCDHKYNCDDSNVCSHEFKWIKKGGISKASSEEGVFTTLNGYKTGPALVGKDECMLDGPEDVFCFTARKQSNTLVVRRSDDEPPQGGLVNAGPAVVPDMSDLQSGEEIEQAPLPGSVKVEPVTSQPSASVEPNVQGGKTQLEDPTPPPNPEVEKLLNKFVAGIDNPSDGKAKAERCVLGPMLLSDFKDALDAETKKLIYGKMIEDGCA